MTSLAALILIALAPVSHALEERQVTLPDGSSLTLVLVPAGSFTMGTPADESPLDPDESPARQVTIDRPLWLTKHEITNAQYRLFAPRHDSREIDTHWKDRVGPGPSVDGDTQPVVRVSWRQAQAFCAWLSDSTGLAFRLPTEQEWEYACRAGTDTPFSCDQAALHEHANYADNRLGGLKPWALRDRDHDDGHAVSAPVGSYKANPWGLHDMLGNVAEWCGTEYREGWMAVRGGSWDDRPRRVRSAFRLGYPPDYRVYNVGFRVAADAGQ